MSAAYDDFYDDPYEDYDVGMHGEEPIFFEEGRFSSLQAFDSVLDFFLEQDFLEAVLYEQAKPEPDPSDRKMRRSFYTHLLSELKFILEDRKSGRHHNDGPPRCLTYTKQKIRRAERRTGKLTLNEIY